MSYNQSQSCPADASLSVSIPPTTNISSYLIEINSHIVSVIEGILTPKIEIIKKKGFTMIKQRKAKQQLPKQMLIFVNHCATMIQTRFRGYQARKYYRLFKPLLKRFKELVLAVVVGWKVRKIMKTSYIERKCQKIREYEKKNNLREARISKREFIEDINLMQNKGNWLLYHQNDAKRKQKTKITNIKTVLRSKNTGIESPNQKPINATPKLKQQPQNDDEKKNKQKQDQILQKQEKQINQCSPQEEIPIKANGFYLLPVSSFPDEQKNMKQSNQSNRNKEGKAITKRETKTKNVANQQSDSAKNPTGKVVLNQMDKKEGLKNIKKEEVSTLNLTMDLAAEHATIQQQILIPNKTVKIQWLKQLTNIENNTMTGNDPKQETQKLKKGHRGIKVTLCTNSLKNEVGNGNVEKKQQKSIVKNQIIKEKDQFSQIMEVYNNAYTNKNIEITNKFNDMKTKRKFVE